MGIFNWVDFEAPCPECGELITEWQSKDGDPSMGTVKPWTVSVFYEACDSCGAWIVYSRRSWPEPPDWRDWFIVNVTPRKPKRSKKT